MRIAVAGGTGLVGTMVTAEARARGHEVVVLSRANAVDALTGAGLDAALEGVATVIDVLNVSTLDATASTTFFEATTRSLLAAEEARGVAHHVALSIVGVDRAPVGYYAGKSAQERAVADGDVPWTLLRATQFHEFAAQIFTSARIGPLHLVPRMRTQPIAAREVAACLVSFAEQPALSSRTTIAGPREESLVDMVRRWAQRAGRAGVVTGIPLPGALGRAQRDGTLLPQPSDAADTGIESFDRWLDRTQPPR